MDVGIRELKSHLSECVERAARGEVIRVTDRGIPRAVLMPVPAVEQSSSPVQFVDSSALLKRYVREPDSETAARLLLADPEWVTARTAERSTYRC